MKFSGIYLAMKIGLSEIRKYQSNYDTTQGILFLIIRGYEREVTEQVVQAVTPQFQKIFF
jgi:hypothetical protein